MYASHLGIKKIHVADTNLRDGLVLEMAQGRKWSSAIYDQMLRSAMQLGNKFKHDKTHAKHVARLATSLFDDLNDLHLLPQKYRSSRHKHSSYLIQNSELFGISRNELTLVSLIARYHRGASPQPSHAPYSRLERDQRITVAKLAAILRIAKALDTGRRQRVGSVTAKVNGAHLMLQVGQIEDLTVEKLELKQNSELFENVFGKRVALASADVDLNR